MVIKDRKRKAKVNLFLKTIYSEVPSYIKKLISDKNNEIFTYSVKNKTESDIFGMAVVSKKDKCIHVYCNDRYTTDCLRIILKASEEDYKIVLRYGQIEDAKTIAPQRNIISCNDFFNFTQQKFPVSQA